MDVKLVMFKVDGQRKDFPIVNQRALIGRAKDCDLRIPLLSVSRRHCELTASAEGVNAKDLASSNGTYVNNQRVNEVALKAGDRLVVGPIVFTVQIDGIPEEIAPVKTRGQMMAEKGRAASEKTADLGSDIAAQIEAELTGSDEAAGGTDEQDSPMAALEGLDSEAGEGEGEGDEDKKAE